jgi:uncharacterized protein (TIGR03118 family)
MSRTRNWKQAAGVAALTLTFLLLGASNGLAQHYQRTDLTADNSSTSPTAPNIDPNLVNAWGMSRGSGSPWWISDNGTSLSTLYDGTGAPKSLVVSIPLPDGTPGGTPTGIVFNYTGAFEVGPGQSAVFLFATEDGSISGWNPNANLTSAIVKINHSANAVYKGLALATTAQGPRLYATNFQSGGVEVFNGKFNRVNVAGGFLDPNLPPNYAPFGIQNVGGNIVVTFAHRKPGSLDEDHGAGLGYVDVFDLAGRLILRLQHGSFLNAPWGIALAPGDFGQFSHRLLIGNFGDGYVHAFNAVSGKFEGTLLDPSGYPLWVDGLWGLSFGGNSTNNGMATELFFTAGPNDESNGILGKITPVTSEQRGNSE